MLTFLEKIINLSSTRRSVFLIFALFLLLLGLPAQAKGYIFPGTLPSGCSVVSSGNYACGALALGKNDTITINSPKPATIQINGTFTTDADTGTNSSSIINASGAASDLNFVVTGVTTLAANTTLNANVTGSEAINMGAGSTVGGYIATTTGVVTLGANVTVTGNITTEGGAVNVGDGSTVGAIKTAAGVVTLSGAVHVIGGITTAGGAVNVGAKSEISGSIETAAGVVTTGDGSKVSGSITTQGGDVTIGTNGSVGGNIKTAAGVVVTNNYSHVGGSVTTQGGGITIGAVGATVCGSATSTGGGVVVNAVTGTTTNVCSTTPTPTCIVDDFASGTLNPVLWNPLTIAGTYTPAVASQRIRMTTAVGNQSTMLQLKKWFPGKGNKITVTFDYYVYGGNGADGVTVVFSDASIAPAPGGFGGSLGYAQRNDPNKNGFNGGWLAVGLDEYGNFPNSSEGRIGYPAGWTAPTGAKVGAGFSSNNISVRGSGSGTTGYALLANTGTLSTSIWQSANTSSTKQRFKITIDHTNNVNAYVTVERDAANTGTYVLAVPKFDVKAAPGQAAVPDNWLVSFTGGTGGNYNNHEIANLSICATFMNDPGGSSNAGAFECLESGTNATWSASARKPLYTKLVSTDFKLDIAALKTDGSKTLESNYVAAGGNSKYAKVELFDDTTPLANCSAYINPVASQTVTFASGAFSGVAGRTLTGNFNMGSAYKALRCRVKECTDSTCGSFSGVTACSSDQFSVRPTAATLATSATNSASSDTPVFKAGTDTFSLNMTANHYSQTATTVPQTLSSAGGYTGRPQVGLLDVTPMGVGTWAVGSLGLSALAPAVASVSTNTTTYSEVGLFKLAGYWPSTASYTATAGDDTAARGLYDNDWTQVDSAQADCVVGSYSNRLTGGKYGCNFGLVLATTLGRFIPDHFDTTVVQTGTSPAVVPMACPTGAPLLTCPSNASGASGAVYSGQSFTVQVSAKNLSGATTVNYQEQFAKGVTLSAVASSGGAAISTTAPGGTLSLSRATAATDFVSGVNTVAMAKPVFTFATTPTAPTNVYIRARDTDSVSSLRVSSASSIEGGVKVVSGRIRIPNVYGSELLALPMTATVQYYNEAWLTSLTDQMTPFLITSVTPSLVKGPLTLANLTVSAVADTACTAALFCKGTKKITLSNSAHATGSVNISLTGPTAPGYLPSLPGLATFGVYRSPLIYRRENF